MIAIEEDEFLELAQAVMSLPTAPFCEDLVSGFIRNFAAQLPSLTLHQDSVGNLLVMHTNLEDEQPGGPHLIATAHMDHPGLVFEEHLSERDFLFRKKGGIPLQFTEKAKVAIYNTHHSPSQSPIAGKITAVVDGAGGGSSSAEAGFRVRVARSDGEAVQPDSFAMWDLVGFEKRKRWIRGRACDDLVGVACGLYYLQCLSRANEPVCAGLLLTRAEEIGFGGMAAAVDGDLDRSHVYVNIECSNAVVAAAVPGRGPIIRVGDRLSTFDPEVTAGMCFLAAGLGTDFRFQRKLMDGGACEASMLMQAGFRTGALALPLENYHNNGKKGLRPERIHLDDALGLVRLLIAFATSRDGVSGILKSASHHLRSAMERGQQQHAARLRETMKPPRVATKKDGVDGSG